MKYTLIIWLAFLMPVLSAQSESVVIEWNAHHGRYSFPHALYEDGWNTLPYYTRNIPWDAAGMLPEVDLEVTAASPVDAAAMNSVPTGHVGTEPSLETALVREMGRNILSVKVLPFFYDESGSLLKVDAMEFRIGRKMALARLKSQSTGSWKEQSVLSSGTWYKVAVSESGMHSFTYEQLREMGIQDPGSVRIYGTGARLLPEAYSQGALDDLEPVPVHFASGADGLFSPGDQVLFYAEGPVSWSYNQEESMFIHQLHPYSDKGYYFITESQGLPVLPETLSTSGGSPGQTITEFDYRDYVEDEIYNLLRSGREWYGDIYEVNLQDNYAFRLPGHVAGDTARVRVALAARSGVTSSFQIRVNNQNKGRASIRSADLSTYTSTYAYTKDTTVWYIPESDNLTVSLTYNRPDSNSEGWLDYISLNARSPLVLGTEDQVSFRESRKAGAGQIRSYRVGNAANAVIWDITQPASPMQVPYTVSGSAAEFTLQEDGIREYIAFNPDGSFPSPDYTSEGLGSMENQNLHGLAHPDMVIITPTEFLEQARRLADHRSAKDGLEVEVVIQEQVFNEFSSGTPDVTAIRNFMKMFYDRSNAGGNGESCKYLLLFGDGSFANRDQPGKSNNPNKLLTYQSPNSLSPTLSYVSDDFFGLLDTDEAMYNGLLDIGIGRFPVSTPEQAEQLVDKVIAYDDPANHGDWRNQICFIGDDEDSNIHMRQADELATYVNGQYPSYNINKIYLDAYPQEKTATGFRYPDVVRAINNQVNRGALIINYTGHGGTDALTAEKIVTLNSISSWSNKGQLPLFMTATCEFSRYDDYALGQDLDKTSAGEQVLLSTIGGGIALFTTTRLVYSGPNHVLNEKFYEVVFEKDQDGSNYRLGDIIAYSKNNTGAGVNKRNFTLLGDPSMRLSYPENYVVTDSINGIEIELFGDTVSAFDWVTISGHVETREGNFLDGFNGEVYPVVFDKEKTVETLANDNVPVWNFKTRNSILYSGKATVKDGRFHFGFFVPKDINYAYGFGKISYYSSDTHIDAHGSTEQFKVGGIGNENVVDNDPPEVTLFMNDTFFIQGGITDDHPTLLVYASDNFGINTTGNGIGHDLTATLDGNRMDAIILNEFYQANTDSYNSGIIRYPYSNLSEGRHEITVKIWDIHNNSSQETIDFMVVTSEEMLLEQILNYPNPFEGETLFSIQHNRPDRQMELQIRIYDLNGQLVRLIKKKVFSSGYRLEPVPWDGTGTGGSGLGAGTYLYQVILSTEEGETASESGKLIMLGTY